MGIYERDYVKQGRGSGSGGRGGVLGFGAGTGRLSAWSVNTWIIVINVAVFVVFNVLLGARTVNVGYGREMSRAATPSQIENAVVLNDVAPRPHPSLSRVLYTPIVAPDPGSPTGFVEIGRDRFVPGQPLTVAWLSFSTWKGFLELQVWRLVTYQFTHANFGHILMNMFALWMFGSMVEGVLGRRRYLAFYLACGVAGGLVYLLLNAIGAVGVRLPGALGVQTITPLVGASAGVFGVLMGAARIAPDSKVYLLFLPIPLKLSWIAYGYVAFAALNLFVLQGNNQGGDAAHFGGALAGFVLIRNAHWLTGFLDIVNDSTKVPSKGPKRAVRSRADARNASRVSAGPGTAEVDRILDKVRAEGLGSLTEREQKQLKKASEAQGWSPH